MGSKPSPEEQARRQQGYNRDSMRDAAQFNQINQQNPWGSTTYSGEIGSPDRMQTTTLNAADQGRLDQTRSLKSGLLAALLGAGAPGGGQGKSGMPQQPPAMDGRTPPFLPEIGRNKPMDHTIYEERIGR